MYLSVATNDRQEELFNKANGAGQPNISAKQIGELDINFPAQVQKSVDRSPGMLTEDHHHTVHEERQVCNSSYLSTESLHL